jgi:hypothetical protein
VTIFAAKDPHPIEQPGLFCFVEKNLLLNGINMCPKSWYGVPYLRKASLPYFLSIVELRYKTRVAVVQWSKACL